MKIAPSIFPTHDLSAAHLWMTPILEVRTGHTNSLSSHQPQVSAPPFPSTCFPLQLDDCQLFANKSASEIQSKCLYAALWGQSGMQEASPFA